MSQLSERFAMHRARCYKCKRRIRGVRWVNSCDVRYSACSRHVCGHAWYAVHWPWCSIVPVAPLSEGDSGASVAHLQMLLTMLGFMRLRDTKSGVGCFDRRTAKRVKQFRECHGIVGCNMQKYSARTAKKLEEIVKLQCKVCVVY